MAYFSPYYNQNNPTFNNMGGNSHEMGDELMNGSDLNYYSQTPSNPTAKPTISTNSNTSNVGGKIGKGVNAAAVGIQGFNTGQQSTQDYTVDPYAGVKGAANGFSGSGWVGAITGGVGGYLGNYDQINKNLKKLDTSVQGYGTDQEGNVQYNGQAFVNADNNIKALQKGIDSSANSDPNSFNDFAGKVLGPGAGEVLDTIFGTKKKTQRKLTQLQMNRDTAQAGFNNASQTATNRRLSKEQYLQRTNNYNKLYNLYNR